MVPGGTSMYTSLPLRPWHSADPPPSPFSARQCFWWTMPAKLSAPVKARMIPLPPLPPSPPLGPPRGTYFSRRKLHIPRPPSPPDTNKVTRSTNIAVILSILCADARLVAAPPLWLNDTSFAPGGSGHGD